MGHGVEQADVITPAVDERIAFLQTRLEAERAGRQAAEEELVRLRQEVSRFASAAAHDLAEPLRTISGFAALMQRQHGDSLPGDAGTYLHFIADGTERMRRMLDALIAYSRSAAIEVPATPVPAGEAVQRAVDALRPRLDEVGAQVVVGILPSVRADTAALERLVSGLLANAITFVAPGVAPRVEVTAGREDDVWRFEVADNGVGVPEESAERIFDMFTRAHSREEYEGSGVGLAVCRRIAERHGGRIGVRPRDGGGSVFWFSLPAR